VVEERKTDDFQKLRPDWGEWSRNAKLYLTETSTRFQASHCGLTLAMLDCRQGRSRLRAKDRSRSFAPAAAAQDDARGATDDHRRFPQDLANHSNNLPMKGFSQGEARIIQKGSLKPYEVSAK
jgi:hypothetical protein